MIEITSHKFFLFRGLLPSTFSCRRFVYSLIFPFFAMAHHPVLFFFPTVWKRSLFRSIQPARHLERTFCRGFEHLFARSESFIEGSEIRSLEANAIVNGSNICSRNAKAFSRARTFVREMRTFRQGLGNPFARSEGFFEGSNIHSLEAKVSSRARTFIRPEQTFCQRAQTSVRSNEPYSIRKKSCIN